IGLARDRGRTERPADASDPETTARAVLKVEPRLNVTPRGRQHQGDGVRRGAGGQLRGEAFAHAELAGWAAWQRYGLRRNTVPRRQRGQRSFDVRGWLRRRAGGRLLAIPRRAQMLAQSVVSR